MRDDKEHKYDDEWDWESVEDHDEDFLMVVIICAAIVIASLLGLYLYLTGVA